VTILDVNRTATPCNHNQGIPRSAGYCPNFVVNIGSCSLWSCIFMPTLAIWVISPDSLGLPSITLTCFVAFGSSRGIWWWRAKSWSINAMPVAPQSISAFIGISWLFTVNVQVITKCFPSFDPSNTSTLLTDNCEIPKHFKGFETKLFLSTKAPSCLSWPNLFPIPWNLP